VTDGPLRLYISAGLHVSNPGDRLNEIEAAVDTVEVVFVESVVSDPPDWGTTLRNTMAAPLLLVAIYTWVTALRLWTRATGLGDGVLADRLVNRHGAEKRFVDKHFNRIIAETRILWFCGHYLTILVAIFTLPTALSYSSPLLFIVMLLAALLGAMFSFYVAGTFSTRDSLIAEDVRAYDGDASVGCLIVGSRHEPGVRARLEETPGIELIDSD
jgi:hypothetical protein